MIDFINKTVMVKIKELQKQNSTLIKTLQESGVMDKNYKYRIEEIEACYYDLEE